tara:strand:- start:216 stop:947 length:732 start_codon:yes stop_codon:yes gene_type:complete
MKKLILLSTFIIISFFACSEDSNDDIQGCTDVTACNYNSNANVDDGSCTYAEGNLDCDDNCTEEIDCAGVCGGMSVTDECGICNGDGFSLTCVDTDDCVNMDCSGTCGGSSQLDDCGICGGDGSSCTEQDIFTLGNLLGNSLEVNFSSTQEISGFQFTLTGAIPSAGSGGAAESAGFSVSAGPGAVLGFSFTGDSIPPGSGLLTNLDVSINTDATEICITNLIVSDSNAQQIGFQIGDCIPIQ